MKTNLTKLMCAAAIGALCSTTAIASGGDDPSPTPSASPTATASPSATPNPTATPTATATPGNDDHRTPSPTPTASPTPGDDHGGVSPTPSPSASPSASPTATPSDDHHGVRDDDHGEISLHGLFEGTASNGGIVLIYVEKKTHLQVNVLDAASQTIGFAEGEMVNNAFTFTLSTGQSISGAAAEHAITGSVGSATFTAQRAEDFGEDRDIAGRFTGVASGPNGQSNVTFVIDVKGNIALIQTSGTLPNVTRTGGFGTVTAPVAPATNFTFTLNKTIGSSSPITGSFTITNGVFQGTFTTSAGTFTVNSFKSSLANRMANISTRGLVGSGQGQLIGGFIITGGPKLVLIRAIGPSLAALGVSPALDNPSLQLFAGQTALGSNDDWKANANAAAIVASGLAPTSDLESALLVRLEPGAYTTIVSGAASSATAVGLVEVYEVDSD